MPTLVPLLLLCLDTFALGVLVTLWFVFEVGWMGGGERGPDGRNREIPHG